MRAIFATVISIFSKVLFWMLLDHNYVQSSFVSITRQQQHFERHPFILMMIHANSFIKTWVSIMNWILTKWPNTLKQFVGNLPTNCLSEFGHFVGLALKGLKWSHVKSYGPGPQRALHLNRWYFTYSYTLLFLSNESSFQI